MPKPWKTLARTQVQQTPVFAVDAVVRQPPWDAEPATFFVVDLASWVNVFAYTDDDELVMIRQYRHGTDTLTLEVPGGVIDADESPLEAARRELREETGYTARQWIEVGSVEVNPAIQNNRCTTFVALGAALTHAPEPDEHEEIDVVTRPAASLSAAIRSGEVTHSLVVAGAWAVEAWRADRAKEARDV